MFDLRVSPFTAVAPGGPNCALTAGPPVPEYPYVSLPATVMIVPLWRDSPDANAASGDAGVKAAIHFSTPNPKAATFSATSGIAFLTKNFPVAKLPCLSDQDGVGLALTFQALRLRSTSGTIETEPRCRHAWPFQPPDA